MEPIKVDALLLRTLLPDVALREGARMVGRVAARAEGQPLGTLMLAGVPLTAQLPEEVTAGETLRLTVTEITPERVTLRMDPPVAPEPPPPPLAQPQPARVAVREAPRRTGEGDDGAVVVLAFESSALGRLDLRVELAQGAVHAAIAAPAGRVTELASAEAQALRDELARHVGRPATVRVTPRRDPVDLYA